MKHISMIFIIHHTYENAAFASLSYFRQIWKSEQAFIKFHKMPLLTKCLDCERLRSSLLVAAFEGKDTNLLSHRDAHVEFLAEERRPAFMPF